MRPRTSPVLSDRWMRRPLRSAVVRVVAERAISFVALGEVSHDSGSVRFRSTYRSTTGSGTSSRPPISACISLRASRYALDRPMRRRAASSSTVSKRARASGPHPAQPSSECRRASTMGAITDLHDRHGSPFLHGSRDRDHRDRQRLGRDRRAPRCVRLGRVERPKPAIAPSRNWSGFIVRTAETTCCASSGVKIGGGATGAGSRTPRMASGTLRRPLHAPRLSRPAQRARRGWR